MCVDEAIYNFTYEMGKVVRERSVKGMVEQVVWELSTFACSSLDGVILSYAGKSSNDLPQPQGLPAAIHDL